MQKFYATPLPSYRSSSVKYLVSAIILSLLTLSKALEPDMRGNRLIVIVSIPFSSVTQEDPGRGALWKA